MKDELYNMNLHEKRGFSSNTNQTKEWILRVVGGWIYYRQQFIQRRSCEVPQVFETATFVPEPIERVMSINTQDTRARIVEMRNNILNHQIETWLDKNYDEQHKLNSLRKHLNVDDVSKCLDPDRKKSYLEYLQSK
jgi:hypothetical protein